MYEVTMPKLSDSMTEGKIIEWKVKEGQPVQEGQVIAEVESDKAAMELECFHTGVLSKIVEGDGSEVAVGAVIAYIAAKGEAAAEPKSPPAQMPAPAEQPPNLAKVRTKRCAVRTCLRKVTPRAEPKFPAAKVAAPAPSRAVPEPKSGRIAVSPYAR